MRINAIQSDLLRKRKVVDARNKFLIEVNGQQIINFSHNDYLGLADDEAVKAAAKQGIDQYGLGSAAAAQVSGYYKAHQSFERAFAAFLNCDKAILFSSGYLANLAVFSALANQNDTVFLDKASHASIYDGLKLSNANLIRYHSHCIQHVEQRYQQQQKIDLWITESVKGMSGQQIDLKKYATINDKKVFFVIDEAHSIGVLGKHGDGAHREANLTQAQAVVIAPLGKAFGMMGGIVAGNKEHISNILQHARSYRYTTAIPPAIAYAGLTILKKVKQEEWRRTKVKDLSEYFNEQAQRLGIQLLSDHLTPIKAIQVTDNQRVLALQTYLLTRGFLVAAIRPPTVPLHSARIRISLSSLHTEQQIQALLSNIQYFFDHLPNE